MFWGNKAWVHLHELYIQRQLCAKHVFSFKFTAFAALAVTYWFSQQKSPNSAGRSNNFPLAFSPVSWQQYSVCLLYGCRRLHLHISFVFWQHLMCCDAAPSVMRIWMGCVQRLTCQGEKDPDWQRDDLSLSQTNPFQIGRRITHTHQLLFLDWLDSEMVIAF